mmetsp:Transcript_107685/g.169981  ORF Transcript_107685/g.169981 Transcript_107685/m.169981 type:complete len:1257 (-) Transcript_107685:15-3785(-)
MSSRFGQVVLESTPVANEPLSNPLVDKIEGMHGLSASPPLSLTASPRMANMRIGLQAPSEKGSLSVPASPLMSAPLLNTGSSIAAAYPTLQSRPTLSQMPPSSPSITTGPPRSRPPPVPVPVQYVTPPPAPVVAMPASVLSHIDSVMTEMERELSEIRAYEQRQEACELRQGHLSDIRRLIAERLLTTGEEEDELRLMKAEIQRLSALEADHIAARRQVADLENQRNTSERDRDELLRVRRALEQECDTRMSELRAAAELVESEKLRARKAEESANERVMQAAYEARALHAELIEAEALTERERLRGAEAIDSQASAEADLKALEGNSRAVLIDCRNLQAKVQELEAERADFRARINELESECSALRSMDESNRSKIVDLEREIDDHHQQHEEHHRNIKVHITRIQELEIDNTQHGETITRHITQVEELQRVLGERSAEIEDHVRKHEHHRRTLADLEKALGDHQERDRAHHQQHAVNRSKLSELERELMQKNADLDSHSKQVATLRQKIVEVEQVVGDHEAASTAHNQQHTANRTRIQELQQDILSVQGERDSYAKQCLSHRTKITEYEQRFDEWQVKEEKHNRAHSGNKSRIAELESLLSNAQAADASHAKQHIVNRGRITELEQQLADLQIAHDNHARQNHVHRGKLTNLERELEEARGNDGKHHHMHSSNRTRISELEEKLADLETSNDGHLKTRAANQARIATLQQELEALQNSHGELDRLHYASRLRVQELEDTMSKAVADHGKQRSELEDALANASTEHGNRHAQNDAKIKELLGTLEDLRASEAHHRSQHEFLLSRVEDLQANELTVASNAREAEIRMKSLMAELEDSRRSNVKSADIQRNAADTAQKYEILLKSQAVEFEEKLRQANITIKDLKEKLERKQAAKKSIRIDTPEVIRDSNPSFKQAIKARQSLWGDLLPTREYLVGPLMPNSSHEFVKKVQVATNIVGDAFKMANEAHVRCLDGQIRSAYDASNSGRDVKDAILHYAERFEIESQRREASEELDAASHTLKALREELVCHRDLSMYEQQEVAARIELDLSKCVEEIELLRLESALGNVPESVLQMLLQLHDTGPATVWDDGFSPMHWAARSGRRDIIEYLLRLQGGLSLLASRDKYGRAPIYYAQSTKRPALTHWLQEQVVGDNVAPIQVQQGRPGGIPEPYLKVLTQIEKHGWDAMNWRDGYTMLHWAASKGHIDVCKYLIQLDADVHVKDASGRSPLDIANESLNSELASALQSAFSARRSIAVKY